MQNTSLYTCYLCGQSIDGKLKRTEPIDHLPPRQFFPKETRRTQNLNLDKVPCHNICNGSYKNDEEYFYHSLYPIVAKNNPQMGTLCSQDIQRRSLKPQTRSIIQKILSTKSTITQGGIYLPDSLAQFTLDGNRLIRVAKKIARGLIFSATERYYEDDQISAISFYDNMSEFIKLYLSLLQLQPLAGVYPKVFAHSLFHHKNFYLIVMLFWGSFVFSAKVDEKS
jgi:hypothetical protein